jgi:uncharacterized membrane-anchored protein
LSVINGTAQKGRKTKDLVKRLTAGDIAVIDHRDIDRVSAEGLVRCQVRAVLNVDESISGRYPNVGPQILVDAGIVLVDINDSGFFDFIQDGEAISVDSNLGTVYAGEVQIAEGTVLDHNEVARRTELAEQDVNTQLELFVSNTVDYLNREKISLIYDPWVPVISTPIRGRQVLVVARGYDYEEDLKTLTPYIREMRPVLFGVDGGADALVELGFKPDIIIGDMDSVTDSTLLGGAEIIPHAYNDGTCPSRERLEGLGIEVKPWPLAATSEDLALLLAWEKKADLIVALGTHSNLIEYLDKGRSGMASSFLIRLKVGTKLVDAKGVSKLYRASPPAYQILVIALAALVVVVSVIAISAPLRNIFVVIWLNLRTHLGF